MRAAVCFGVILCVAAIVVPAHPTTDLVRTDGAGEWGTIQLVSARIRR